MLASHSAASPVSGRAAGHAESLQFHVDGCTARATTQTPGSAEPARPEPGYARAFPDQVERSAEGIKEFPNGTTPDDL